MLRSETGLGILCILFQWGVMIFIGVDWAITFANVDNFRGSFIMATGWVQTYWFEPKWQVKSFKFLRLLPTFLFRCNSSANLYSQA